MAQQDNQTPAASFAALVTAAQQYVHDSADMPAAPSPKSHQAFENLIERARQLPGKVSIGIVWPCERHALESALDAAKQNIVEPVLVGARALITEVAHSSGLDLGGVTIVEAATPQDAAAQAVALVRSGQVHALMKGSLHTDVLMHAVVSPESGLRTARRVSHVFLLAMPAYDDLIFVTDAAINIFPDLTIKRDIVQNAIDLHRGSALGNRVWRCCPRWKPSIRKFPARWMRPPCAKWRTGARLKAAFWMARWPWITP